MKKSYLGLAMVLLILGIVAACKGPGCLVQEKLVDAATQVVVEKLECDAFTAVREDVTSAISKVGLCKDGTQQTGAIADLACPLVADQVVDKAFSAGVPERWHCKATSAKATVKDLLVAACKKIPVSQQ